MYQLEVKNGDHKSITQFANYNEAHEEFSRKVYNDSTSKVELFEIEVTATLLAKGEYGEIE